jgi:uncharacterized repeat protein (TIGR01451 family)
MAIKIVDVQVASTIVGGDPNVYQGQNAQIWVKVSNVPYVVGGTVNDADSTFLQTVMPAGFTAIDWSGQYFGGAIGSASGTGSLVTQIASLPAGGWAEFTINVMVSPNAALGFVRVSSIASLVGDRCPLNAQSMTGFVDLRVFKKRTSVTVVKSGSGSFERGKTSTFTVEVTNSGPNSIVGGGFFDELPKGVYIRGWSAAYTGGANGSSAGNVLPVSVNIPVNGKVTYTVKAWISPNACLGAAVNTAVFKMPPDVAAANGADCVKAAYDFQILNPSVQGGQRVHGCLKELCVSDTAVPVGYVNVRLTTPGGVPAYDPATGRQLLNGTMYRFPIDANGCWETCDLPVNSLLVTNTASVEPIPSYYELWVFAASQSRMVVNPEAKLQYHARFRLSADDALVASRNVLELDELNPFVLNCISSSTAC